MRKRAFSALRQSRMIPASALILIAGTLFSRIGDSLASLGMVLDAADSGIRWGVTEVFLADLLPPVIAAPLIGSLVDRLSARTVWLWALVLQAVTLGAAALVNGFHLRVGLIAVAGLIGVASASASFKILPIAAGKERTGQANSLLTAGLSAASLLGPALGGLLHSLWGTTLMLGADAASFLVLAACTSVAVPVAADVAAERRTGGSARITSGFHALRRAPVIGMLLPTLAAVMLGTSIEGVAGVFYLRGIAHGNDTLYGLFLASWALGSIPGALIAGRAAWSARHLPLIMGGALTISFGLLFAGLVPVVAAIFVTFVTGGFGNGVHNVGVRNAVHAHVPAELHGSAWASYSAIANCCVGLGYLLGTPNSLLSSRTLVALSGALPLAFVLWGFLRLRGLRQSATDGGTEDMTRGIPSGEEAAR